MTATRTVQVNVMLTEEGAKQLDKQRKNLTRSVYIRRAMAYAIKMGFVVEDEL